MKRKLFTLLFAFLALASFQVNAQTKYLIHAARVANNTTTNDATNYAIPSGTTAWSGSATNYAGVDNLAWTGRLQPGANATAVWKWEETVPTIGNDSKKVLLKQGSTIGANFTQFVDASNGSIFKLTYANIVYDKFVIFRGSATNTFIFDLPYTGTIGSFDHVGFLSVNTAANPTDDDLVIVMVKTNGTDKGSLKLESISYLRTGNNANNWAPFAFYAEEPHGRWATAADFADSKYWSIPQLSVAHADSLTTGGKYSQFTVTQVDWVAEDNANQSLENIFGDDNFVNGSTTTNYYESKFTQSGGGNQIGLQMGVTLLGSVTGNVIPLFILSSPQVDCNVVSVSRKNDLGVQAQVDGGYGNKLELRPYGTYYHYSDQVKGDNYRRVTASAGSPWDSLRTGSPLLDELRVATSLQKFAIWIDEDGVKTIYPAASYFWKYGESKEKANANVLPNSVLMYNNTKVEQSMGGTIVADRGWGIMIDKWKTHRTATPATGEIITGPNLIQSSTDYDSLKIVPAKITPEVGSIAGKFFFLDATVDVSSATGDFAKATAKGAYQDETKTQYVLSTEINAAGEKHLIVLPKEKVRKYSNGQDIWYNADAYKRIEKGEKGGAASLLRDYWSNNPYDSINMAAHWGIYQQANKKYVLVNMLGDTLRYEPNSGEYKINGGYKPVNNLLAATDANPNQYGYFSPEGGNTGHWFGNWTAPTLTSVYEWEIESVPGKDGFILKLAGQALSLALDKTNWYEGATAVKTAAGDSLYWQHDVELTSLNAGSTDPKVLNKYADVVDNCAGGLILNRTPIYYVPNYSGSYGNEPGDTLNGKRPIDNWKTINTNDSLFADIDAKVFQDSLTAYLLLHGTYGIKEAVRVDNDLLLGAEEAETGVITAALKKNAGTKIQFIPLATTGRTDSIRKFIAASGVTTQVKNGAAIDTLYGETYKWFIVKYGDRYLTFDTINPNALDNRLKVGFTFDAVNIANATPVRLYQPLVGDKLQGNFIFQFQLPMNTYDSKNPELSYRNAWPRIENNNNQTSVAGGTRLFGQLSNQSNYIHGTVDRSKATRFTYVFESSDVEECNCEETFVSPKWLAQEKIVGLPVQNRIWLQDGTDRGFGSTAATGNEAVVVKDTTKELTHEYVTSIKRTEVSTGVFRGRYVWKYTGKGANYTNKTDFYNLDYFKGEVDSVPLYRIKQGDKYLTVGNTTYQYDSKNTIPDVTGVNLIWADKYVNDSLVNKEALQLFAISGPESEADANGWYADCHPYVYLPLASYKVKYDEGRVIPDDIYYNVNLGKAGANCDKNDITTAFRVSQYSPIDRDVKNLIVANASGADLTNVVPVELKWKKLKYDKIGCPSTVPGMLAYQLVKDLNGGFFYASGGDLYDSLPVANSNTILAHWAIIRPAEISGSGVTDPYLHIFARESLNPSYGNVVPAAKVLAGDWYFKRLSEAGDTTTTIAFNFDNYDKNYTIVQDTFQTICVDHTLPYYNLELDGGYELPAQLAILEAPFVDRNLTDSVFGLPSDKINNDSYQAYLNSIGHDINAAKYLRAYKSNERWLSSAGMGTASRGHVIPYYAFSVTRVENGVEKEYFLNVRPSTASSTKDSVYWSTITESEFNTIKSGQVGNSHLKYFIFCLPYQVETKDAIKNGKAVKKGDRVDSVKYGEPGAEMLYPPVYLQTLDVAVNDYPYLVITGSATKYVTAVNLRNAIENYSNGTDPLVYNIFSVDYAQIDERQVTAWIFGGKKPGDHEWVPLHDPVTDTYGEKDVDGLLTNYKLNQGGFSFVSESQESPVNYGVLLGKTQLHFKYEGTEQIGNLWKRPIYYYRIQIPGDDNKWLTDSKDSIGNYIYTWGKTEAERSNYNLAYFGKKITDNVTGKTYDKKYAQTFGLHFVDASDPKKPLTIGETADETFVVVSTANYQSNTPESAYRYLAEVNGHLVFVGGLENALIFQFGRDVDGKYTGIEPVGQIGVVGVQGGVRFLNQTGTANIYSIDGSLIKSVQVTGADQTITAPRGVVIVKVAGKATKVIVK